MTRTQKAAVKEFLQRTGLGTTFRTKPKCPPPYQPVSDDDARIHLAQIVGSDLGTEVWSGDWRQTLRDTSARLSASTDKPRKAAAAIAWLRRHTIAPLIRLEQAAAKDPATAGVFLFGVALPVVLLAFVTIGLALSAG